MLISATGPQEEANRVAANHTTAITAGGWNNASNKAIKPAASTAMRLARIADASLRAAGRMSLERLNPMIDRKVEQEERPAANTPVSMITPSQGGRIFSADHTMARSESSPVS